MNKSVLIVDDNVLNLKLARLLLTAAGFPVVTAAGAEEALQILEGPPPRLILMDIQMPGIDGLELTRRLKADPQRSVITIVALTSYAMKGDCAKILAASCDGYIPKPIDVDTFVAAISSFLQTA